MATRIGGRDYRDTSNTAISYNAGRPQGGEVPGLPADWYSGGALDPQRIMGALVSQAQTAMDEANQANRDRAEAIRGRYDELMTSTMGDLEGMGAEELAATNRQYDKLGASTARGLARSGLASSTVMPSVMRGVEEQRGQATRQLGEGLRRERIGYRTGIEGNRLGFEERINETGPSIQDIAAMASQLGTSSPGGYSLYLPTGGSSRTKDIAMEGGRGFQAPGGTGVFQQAANTGIPYATSTPKKNNLDWNSVFMNQPLKM